MIQKPRAGLIACILDTAGERVAQDSADDGVTFKMRIDGSSALDFFLLMSRELYGGQAMSARL